MPVLVVTQGFPHQAFRHFATLDPVEAVSWGTGAIPAVGSAAPVPAVVEEHFLGTPFHHLDAWTHFDERRGDGQVEIDVHVHSCLGH